MLGQKGVNKSTQEIKTPFTLKTELSACIGMFETTEIHFNRKPMYKIECQLYSP